MVRAIVTDGHFWAPLLVLIWGLRSLVHMT